MSWMRWIERFQPLLPRFSIATKGAISPVTATWNGFFPAVSWSVWTGRDGLSTISSPNASGEASSTKRFTSMNTTVLVMPGKESGTGSSFTIQNDPTNPWNTRPLGKFSWQGATQNLLQSEPEGGRSQERDSVSDNVLKNDLKTVLTKPPTLTSRKPNNVAHIFRTTGSECAIRSFVQWGSAPRAESSRPVAN